MNNIIRIFNQNRKIFYKIISIIFAFIVFIHILNWYYEDKQKKEYESFINNLNQESDSELKTPKDLINIFIENCKSNEYENAYSLLSDNTREKMEYKTLELFKSNFCDSFIEDDDEYKIEYINNIYIINVYNSNALETGKVKEVFKYLSVYNQKITIEDCIYTKEMNENYNVSDNVSASVKKVFKEKNKVKYKMYITNNSNQVLNLNEYILKKYLELENDEITGSFDEDNIQINAKETKTVNLVFDIDYERYSQINKIVIITEEGQVYIQP